MMTALNGGSNASLRIKEIGLIEVWITEKYLSSNEFLDCIKDLLMG
jgi:hypothetical protein